MNKKVLWFSLGILCLTLIGCGQLTDQHTERVSALGDQILNQNGNNTNTGDNDEVLATNKITLTIGDPKASLSPQAITAKCLIASQSVNIVADVPGFLTFQACSDIFFNVTQLSKIEADGSIKLKIIYNDLLSKDIESIKVKACMLDANGLIGQKEPQSIIPLEVKVVDEKPYQDLNTNCAELKNWKAPFTQGINKVLTLKLKGDFTNALKQQYKGTILLKLVKEKSTADNTWKHVTSTLPWNFFFDNSATTYNGYMWVVGGFDFNKVLKSINGKEWTETSANTPWTEKPNAIAFKDKLWVFGYQGNTNLWNTSDGSSWQLINSFFLPSYIDIQGLAVFRNKLWVIEFAISDSDFGPYIQSSGDGVNWTPISRPDWGDFYPRKALVFKDKLWVLGDANYAWTSEDGINWSRTTFTGLPEPRTTEDYSVSNNKLWATISNVLYSSENGLRWNREASNPVFIDTLLSYNNLLWGFGNGNLWYFNNK
ncbi:MAG: hypothetical protein DKM50_00225 [Candidatus Margulisiibacteriota bacterium]|nr:MAG: hypothetical protein DKM50_00225 [Candidatus Margulisiibacteriota bacterium]